MQLHILLLAFFLSGSPPALLGFGISKTLVALIVTPLEMVVCWRSRTAENDNPIPVPAPLGKRSKSILLEELVRVEELACRFAPCHQEQMVDHERGWVEESNEAVNDHGERHSFVVDRLREVDSFPMHIDQDLCQ